MKINCTLIKVICNYEIHTTYENLRIINQSHTCKVKFNSETHTHTLSLSTICLNYALKETQFSKGIKSSIILTQSCMKIQNELKIYSHLLKIINHSCLK